MDYRVGTSQQQMDRQRIWDLCEQAKEGNQRAEEYLLLRHNLKVWTWEQLQALNLLQKEDLKFQILDLTITLPKTLKVPKNLQGEKIVLKVKEGFILKVTEEPLFLFFLILKNKVQRWVVNKNFLPLFQYSERGPRFCAE